MIKNEKIVAVRKYYEYYSDTEHVFNAYTNVWETEITVEYTYKGITDNVKLRLDDKDGVGDIIHKLNEKLYKRIARYIAITVNFYCQHNTPLLNNKGVEFLREAQDRINIMIVKEGDLKL